jgi:hypothetical protein
MRFPHFGHAGDERVVGILLLAFQLFEKRCILRPPVRVEKKDAVSEFLPRRTEHNASERGDANAAGREHSCALDVVMESEIARRTLNLNHGAKRNALCPRLNAVSRSRVATINVSSRGSLAIEKPRVFPSASISAEASRVMSRNCPTWNAQPDGFPKRKAIVPSAMSCRLTNLQVIVAAVAVVLMSASSNLSWRTFLPIEGFAPNDTIKQPRSKRHQYAIRILLFLFFNLLESRTFVH